jgi:hypothetical protein
MGKISLDFAQDVLSVIIKITKGDGIYVVWQYWHHIMTLYQGVEGGVVMRFGIIMWLSKQTDKQTGRQAGRHEQHKLIATTGDQIKG